MRITFLAGSLEQGKDGVGDYTRLLAHECASRGVPAQVIALADRHIDHSRTNSSSTSVEIVRLPYGMRWSTRLARAEDRIRRWSPHWVSLQFVPYSFQRWGIATSLVNAMAQLTGPAKRHAMLHEIWTDGASWPQKVIGASQRHCVLKLCRHVSAVVHTSNETYQRISPTMLWMREYCRCLAAFQSLTRAPTGGYLLRWQKWGAEISQLPARNGGSSQSSARCIRSGDLNR